MRKIFRNAGIPLLAAGILGLDMSPGLSGTTFNISIILLTAGGLLLVLSPFIAAPGSGSPPAGPPPAPADGGGAGPGRLGPVPEPSGVDTAEAYTGVPGWVYSAGGILAMAGTAVFMFAPNGVNPMTVSGAIMVPAGVLLIVGGRFFYGGGPARRNILRSTLTIFSFMLILGGIFTGVFIFAGAFAPGTGGVYGSIALGLIAAGVAGAWHGLHYYQSAEGLVIGRQLGFEDASGGGADSFYDSKGRVNGVETLINVEQNSSHRGTAACFRLDVLCRCANPSGVRLEVEPERMLSLPKRGLPRVDAVPYWDYFEVRCDRPDEALRVLPEFRKNPGVFGDAAGFASMSLEGGEFKFTFSLTGYAGTAFVRRVVQEVSMLASRFN